MYGRFYCSFLLVTYRETYDQNRTRMCELDCHNVIAYIVFFSLIPQILLWVRLWFFCDKIGHNGE